MKRWLTAVSIAGAATMVWSVTAAADERTPTGPRATATPDATEIKDCARYNGTFGFYANVWCTPEEQARWDKWEAERLRSTTGAAANANPL